MLTTRRSSEGFLICLSKLYSCLDFCEIWHLGGSGCMGNTPTACADNLPTILGFFKNDPKSRSVISFHRQPDFEPNTIQDLFTSRRKDCLECEASRLTRANSETIRYYLVPFSHN